MPFVLYSVPVGIHLIMNLLAFILHLHIHVMCSGSHSNVECEYWVNFECVKKSKWRKKRGGGA